VALGTICDVVPLTGINRALVAQGLKVLPPARQCRARGLGRYRRSVAEPADAYHAGFVLGPRHSMRAGASARPDLGTRLLATDDAVEARALAERLDALNVERRLIEARVLSQAWRRPSRTASVRSSSSPARAGIPASSASSPGA